MTKQDLPETASPATTPVAAPTTVPVTTNDTEDPNTVGGCTDPRTCTDPPKSPPGGPGKP